MIPVNPQHNPHPVRNADRDLLKSLVQKNGFFVGIDSDGCVFDTMETKQKEFFIPLALRYFDLMPVSKILRETWEFVNLYSVHRGTNRFVALAKTFEILAGRKEIQAREVKLPDLRPLDAWMQSESRLGNKNLEEYLKTHPNPFLQKVLEWSLMINEEIALYLKNIGPYRYVRECLQSMSGKADVMVISQTPLEALHREWEEHGLEGFLHFIAGQEHGTKTEHIFYGAKGKYPDHRILMIGDAPGDLQAALANKVLFYPVIPGKEEYSWERLHKEGLERFYSENYLGSYQEALLAEFQGSLLEYPPWNN